MLATAFSSRHYLPLLFRTQKNKVWAYIDVLSITNRLGESVCDGLLGMHALSGCDSTSKFAGHGKKAAWKLMENEEFCTAMKRLGDRFEPDNQTLKEVERSVCQLYNFGQFTNNNQVRCAKWNRQTTDVTKLPPCHDSVVLHIKRANYQTAVWKRALMREMNAPSPHGNGWIVNRNDITISWMSQPYAPPQVLDIVKCSCKAILPCSTKKCRCRKQGRPCMVICESNDDCCNAEDVEQQSDTD